MPIKIYYSGNCVSFNTSTPPPPPEKNKIENPELDFQPKEKRGSQHSFIELDLEKE